MQTAAYVVTLTCTLIQLEESAMMGKEYARKGKGMRRNRCETAGELHASACQSS